MARNLAVVIVGPDGTERAVHRIQFGAKLKVDEGDEVKRGQRIAEWDPYTRPILTEVPGKIGFEDLVEGGSMTESIDEATGIAKRVVIDWRTSTRSSSLRPAIVINGKDGKIGKLARGGDARYVLPAEAILAVDPGNVVKAGDVLARIPTESAKTRDITGGLPRVAELFEARRPKEAAIIAEKAGTIQFGRDYKNKRRINLVPHDGTETVEYLVPKSKHVYHQDGDLIEKGEFIVDGNPAPHDILAIKGVEELAAYLVNEIQEVYRLQGVNINDKHIEVIVRQMLQKVEISDGGDSDLLDGEQLDRIELEELNDTARRRGQEAGGRSSGAARHHEGLAPDALLHLGRLLPGDDARPHRGRRQRQGGHARGLEGERHCRPPHPGRHGLADHPHPRGREPSRRAHPRAAAEGCRRDPHDRRRAARGGPASGACRRPLTISSDKARSRPSGRLLRMIGIVSGDAAAASRGRPGAAPLAAIRDRGRYT